MKKFIAGAVMSVLVPGLCAFFPIDAHAAKKGIKGMSDAEMILTAKSAAPAYISDHAAVMVPGPDGKLMAVREGTNGFTCIPDISGQDKPDPVCADRAGTEWIMSAVNNEPAPRNTQPGVAYMAQGGWHWEKDGNIVLDRNTPGAKRVKEDAHWMILWPFDARTTLLPDRHSKFGTYVMYRDTPYAHLMVIQDPMKIPSEKSGK